MQISLWKVCKIVRICFRSHISKQKCDVVHGIGGVGKEVVDADGVGVLRRASVILIPYEKSKNGIIEDNKNHLENLEKHFEGFLNV